MALTYPLSLEQFFGKLPLIACDFTLPEVTVYSRTRGGEVLRAEVGVRLWQGAAFLRPLSHSDASESLARISLLGGAGASFLASPWPKCGPRLDPGGSTLGASAPVIHALAGNNRELRIAGLPAGYALSDGDYLSFTYGSSPVRYGFHQIVVGGVADGAGLTPLIEVIPHIRPGATAGLAVAFVRSVIKAVIVPGSIQHGQMAGNRRDGISFEFVQTLGV